MENEIRNFTRVEEDPFADIDLDTANMTNIADEWDNWKPTTLQIIMNYSYVIFGITKFFIVIAVVLVDILIVYLILRYKRLRKNFNLYILHFAILNFASHLIAPIFIIAHLLLRSGYSYFYFFYCYMDVLEETLLFMSFVLALCVGLDWTIFYFKPHTRRIQLAYKNKFIIFYVLLVLLSLINCSSCNFSFYSFASELLLYTMPLFIMALLAMHYERRRRILTNEQLKTEHYLWIGSIAIGVYIPVYLVNTIYRLVDNDVHFELISIIFVFEQILSICSVLSPICILIYLMKWDKHVRMAFDTTFRKTVREYGSDNLDDASDNEEIVEDDVEKNTPRVTNGAGTQDILVP